MARYLTTAEAAARLGVDPSRIRQLVKDGRLKAGKFGQRAHMIEESELANVAVRRGGWPAGKPRKKGKVMALRYATDYAAPPDAESFIAADAAELEGIRTEAEGWSDWSAGDQSALAWALDLAQTGRPVLMARDEDGLYFATSVDQP